MTSEQEIAEHNAKAWLMMTDEELIRCSASLGLPAELHPQATYMPSEHGAEPATHDHLAQLREAADNFAREHAGDEFVAAWLAENRKTNDPERLWSAR